MKVKIIDAGVYGDRSIEGAVCEARWYIAGKQGVSIQGKEFIKLNSHDDWDAEHYYTFFNHQVEVLEA